MLTIILGLFLLSNVFAQTPGQGSCPDVSTQPDFDLNKYSGMWYQIERSAPSEDYLFVKCSVANYSDVDENGVTEIMASGISIASGKKVGVRLESSIAKGACGEQVKGCATTVLRMPNGSEGLFTILETDYTSYTVAWTCQNFLATYAAIAYVYTRDQNPDQSVLDKAKAVLEKNNLQNQPLWKINQDCS